MWSWSGDASYLDSVIATHIQICWIQWFLCIKKYSVASVARRWDQRRSPRRNLAQLKGPRLVRAHSGYLSESSFSTFAGQENDRLDPTEPTAGVCWGLSRPRVHFNMWKYSKQDRTFENPKHFQNPKYIRSISFDICEIPKSCLKIRHVSEKNNRPFCLIR